MVVERRDGVHVSGVGRDLGGAEVVGVSSGLGVVAGGVKRGLVPVDVRGVKRNLGDGVPGLYGLVAPAEDDKKPCIWQVMLGMVEVLLLLGVERSDFLVVGGKR